MFIKYIKKFVQKFNAASRSLVLIFLFAAISLLPAKYAACQHRHDNDPRGTVVLNWQLPQINRVLSAGWGFSFGIEAYPRKGNPKAFKVNQQKGFLGSYFSFDVIDSFAYDIDETITLKFHLSNKGGRFFTIAYDHSIQPMIAIDVEAIPTENNILEATVELPRAHFANGGHGGTDFTVFAKGANPYDLKLDTTHTVAIINIEVIRNFKPTTIAATGLLQIISFDQNKTEKTPIRIGVYDTTYRMPIPAEVALHLHYMERVVKKLFLRTTGERQDYWPSPNRHFFYSGGDYTANLPVGKYSIIATKGPEYLMETRAIEIKPGQTTTVNINMQRWIDMPANGWYSSDAHLHIARGMENDIALEEIMQAEDLHLSNMLEMGNAASTHFKQYAFGKKGQYVKGNFAIVPGVEDPRSVHHGHAIALNVKQALRNTKEYFLYHKILEAYQNQGAYTGYAHVDRDWFHDEYGLTLDVPFGLVDFLEIMQYGETGTQLWYEFLNLGYKLLPIAGSDFPYLDHPGAVRSYTRLNGPFSSDAWFKAYKTGNTFVSNGPMLDFFVNDSAMGATINILAGQKIEIIASAKINPQIDVLDFMELIVNGKPVKKIMADEDKYAISFKLDTFFNAGSWLAIKVYGKQRAMAHTAATYIHIGDGGHKQCGHVNEIVAKHIQYLEQMKTIQMDELNEIEYWEAGPKLPKLWQKLKPILDIRISEAIERYKSLLICL